LAQPQAPRRPKCPLAGSQTHFRGSPRFAMMRQMIMSSMPMRAKRGRAFIASN
jgi:hypothetical protein